jgi:carbonic anhydrase
MKHRCIPFAVFLLLASVGVHAEDRGHDAKPAAVKAAAAAVVAPPAAPAAPDPIEQLRQRLAERLSASKHTATSGPYDLKVVAKGGPPVAAVAATAAPSAQAAHGAPAKPAKAAAKAAEAPAAHAAHWDYKGTAGPAAWGGLKPEFSLCSVGQRQSPIDIKGGLAVDLEPVRFDYQASRFAVVDNGHTVQVNLAGGNSIDVGGKRFDLLQFHFHRPSEERIDGRQFEMSLHLVHKDDQGRLAVVALLFEKGPANAALQKVWNNLPLERNEENAARAPLELVDLLPADRRYFTYMGSLTTPPCSEGVQWIVMRQPVTLTPEQIDIFARIYPMNARPIQQMAGRRIIQSN